MGSKIGRTKKVKIVAKPSIALSSISPTIKSTQVTPPQKQQCTKSWAQVVTGCKSTNGKFPDEVTQLSSAKTQETITWTFAAPRNTSPTVQKSLEEPNGVLHQSPQIIRNDSMTTVSSTESFASKMSNDSTKVSQTSSETTPSSTCSEDDTKPRCYKLVDDEKSLLEFLGIIDSVENFKIDLFADAEGSSQHSRHHKLNAIPLKMVSENQRWLLDPVTLGDKVFHTRSPTGRKRTLKEIFEDESVLMVWFDVRSDADSTYGNYKVRLGGVIDLQIMEMATRSSRPFYRHGLDRCISSLPAKKLLPGIEEQWAERKYAGKRMCSGPERYGIFDKRPFSRELEEYAINDVELMPELFEYYANDKGLCKNQELMRLVMKLSKEAVDNSIAPDYPGNTSSSKFGPEELKYHERFGSYDPYDYDSDYY
jgi:exonuclease 3'-5' domain-containing protein 1